MLLSNKKILVSGCGFSWSNQQHKTWVNVLKSVGVPMIDVGGPAVSNQWIFNKTVLALQNHSDIETVILQTTMIGKLDVEINAARVAELVTTDSVRNFVYNGVWPSSLSDEHCSKRLYNQWLSSPGLETEDLYCKIHMLSSMCREIGAQLIVLQAYEIPWLQSQLLHMPPNVINVDYPLYQEYKSSWYQYHNYTNGNSVPAIQFQAMLAERIAGMVLPSSVIKIQKIRQLLDIRNTIKDAGMM